MERSFSLMVHGGAGALEHVRDERIAARYLEGIRTVLEHGRAILDKGGTAVDGVEACASLLEDDPRFNAGRGSVLNEHGKVEVDAGIMDGSTLAAGAVAAVGNIAHPVQLARLVMNHGEHVLLVGEGALRFAEHCGLKRTPDDYFITPERLNQLTQARLHGRMPLDHDEQGDPQKHGTIGAVARDCSGNLAAATSTGGIVNKRIGRVGDSPIIGAGVYADNATCAVSGTGHGEDFMRTVFAKTIADAIEFRGFDAVAAVEYGIDHLRRKVNGRGGVICIDRNGRCASQTTTPRMIHGWIEQGGETVCRF
jgi:L-asparaginase / beta-aspartyl-peptidase